MLLTPVRCISFQKGALAVIQITLLRLSGRERANSVFPGLRSSNMGIYFLIAVALSAMSVVTEVQVSRPAFATVASVRSERRATRIVSKSCAGQAPARVRISAAPALRRIAVLTGAAAPRAPALGC